MRDSTPPSADPVAPSAPITGRTAAATGRLYAAAELIAFIGLLNALIIAGTLAGGVVFGIAPSLSAAAATTRSHLRNEAGSSVLRFARHWRGSLVRANLLQAPAAIVVVLLVFNLLTVGAAQPVLAAVLATAASIAVVFQVVAVVMDAHYDLTVPACLGLAGRFLVHSPASPLLLAATLALIVLASSAVPGLIPFVSLGATAYFCTALCLSFFTANDQRITA